MQRMFNVSKWQRLCEGGAIRFDGGRPRVVRLELNSPQPVGLYLMEPVTGEALFLCRVVGRDTVEFQVGGKFTLVSDGEVFVYTAGMEMIHHVVDDPVIFTRITERRQVNPEIAAIQRAMHLNMERRLAAQRDEFNSLLRRVVQGGPREAPAGRDRVASDEPQAADVPGTDVPEPAPDEGAAAGAAGAAGGGKRKRAG